MPTRKFLFASPPSSRLRRTTVEVAQVTIMATFTQLRITSPWLDAGACRGPDGHSPLNLRRQSADRQTCQAMRELGLARWTWGPTINITTASLKVHNGSFLVNARDPAIVRLLAFKTSTGLRQSKHFFEKSNLRMSRTKY